jgi:hypothetical protein
MSPMNHEAGSAGLNTNKIAEGSRTVHSPRPTEGVHSPTPLWTPL